MRSSLYSAVLTALILAAFGLTLTACDTATAPATEQAPDLPAPLQSVRAESGPLAAPIETPFTADPLESSADGRFSMWSDLKHVRAGRHFLLYGRRAVWSDGFEFEFDVRTYSGDPNVYLATFGTDGRLRRVISRSRRGPERDESASFTPEDLRSGDAYVGAIVFASSDQDARFRLTLWAQRTELSLRYPLDRARRIVNGYRFGDHWLGGYCATPSEGRLLHAGVDYYAPNFGETVYAAAPGVVRYARSDSKWGGYIVIEHEQAGIGSFTTAYTHVAPRRSIAAGGTVTASTPIGQIASGTGQDGQGYGAHLDFRIRMQPYRSSDLDWILRGRFPERSCLTGRGVREPAFPEHTIDPESIDWTPR